jgi:hypothetical protein
MRTSAFVKVAISLIGVASLVPLVAPAAVPTVSAVGGIELVFVGRANSGSGLAGSEIAAFDPESDRLFVTNGSTNEIDIFDITDPSTPALVSSVDLASLGVTGIQSVASKNGVVAVAAQYGTKVEDGRVFVMDTDGTIDSRAPLGVEVGALPDSVHFTPDGAKVVTADEGEPLDYCLDGGNPVPASDPEGSVSVIDIRSTDLVSRRIDFSGFDALAQDIRDAGGRIYGPNASVAQDLEPEYVAISSDSRTAFVTLQENNAVAEVDLATASVRRIMGLGYKDYSSGTNKLDPSDRDSATNSGINIANHPVKGMYQPDGVGTYTQNGVRYFVTANEGDAREYPCFLGGTNPASAEAEDVRAASVADASITGGTDNALLGRLNVTRVEPSVIDGGSGKYTEIFTLGGRSISVWSAPSSTGVQSATLLADSASQIEERIATEIPDYFNADWNTVTGLPNAKDTRSDNKGPEPEGMAVGQVYGKVYAFTGLERVGGIMAFDITAAATGTISIADYVNSSDFTGNGGANFATAGAPAGDVSPEGLLFVSATDSPTGVPLVIAAHELSGTTAIYEVRGTPTAPTAPTSLKVSRSGAGATATWLAPIDDGGQPIVGYTTTFTPTSGPVVTCESETTSCTVASLPTGSYTVQVSAVTAEGNGAASSTVTYIQRSAPTAPGQPSITKVGDGTSFTISWPAVTAYPSVNRYVVVGSRNGSPIGTVCVATTTSCTIEGLTAAARYSFVVRAGNSVGLSPASPSVTERAGRIPAAPSNLTVTNPYSGTVRASWSPVTAVPAVIGYRVTVRLDGEIEGFCTTTASIRNCTITDLPEGVELTVNVRAVNVLGRGLIETELITLG